MKHKDEARADRAEELARSREKWVEIAKNLLWDSVVLQPAIMDFDDVVAQMADYMQSGYAALLRPRLERAERCAECDKRHAVISNLSMLVRRLIRKHPDNWLREQALDYLRQEGLQGSILREPLPSAPDAEEKA